MYKKIMPIILLAFLIPQITLAAWWNPLTWFNNWTFKKSVQVIQVPKVSLPPKPESENTLLQENEIPKKVENDTTPKKKDPINSPSIVPNPVTKNIPPATIKPITTVEKTLLSELSGEALMRREKLLTALRTGPFFDESKSYPEISSADDRCVDGLSSLEENEVSAQSLSLSQGIYISADGEADLHAYDGKGGHTGLMPKNPEYDFSFPEENAQGIDWINLGSAGYGLAIHENINGRIELVGKNYGVVRFEIRGNGNACEIAEFYVPVTPFSTATLPMTVAGDFGPFSYDIDGDRKQDFLFSLKYPLFPEKQKQLDAIIADMKTVP